MFNDVYSNNILYRQYNVCLYNIDYYIDSYYIILFISERSQHIVII